VVPELGSGCCGIRCDNVFLGDAAKVPLPGPGKGPLRGGARAFWSAGGGLLRPLLPGSPGWFTYSSTASRRPLGVHPPPLCSGTARPLPLPGDPSPWTPREELGRPVARGTGILFPACRLCRGAGSIRFLVHLTRRSSLVGLGSGRTEPWKRAGTWPEGMWPGSLETRGPWRAGRRQRISSVLRRPESRSRSAAGRRCGRELPGVSELLLCSLDRSRDNQGRRKGRRRQPHRLLSRGSVCRRALESGQGSRLRVDGRVRGLPGCWVQERSLCPEELWR